MLGREAYHRPYVLAELEQAFWGAGPAPTEEAMADWLAEYTARHVANGGRVHDVARHALGLFAGKPGARAWRRYLSEHSNRRDVTPGVFANAAQVARQLSAQDEIALRQ
jgi:tRNA-dihydrouridine synthase A